MTRLPPHNLEAEESTLGSMMLSREGREKCLQIVTAADFYKPSHGHIFDAIATLHRDGLPVDPVTVADLLDRQGVLGECGGRPALLHVQGETPSSANAHVYARLVMEASIYRGLIRAAGEITELGYGAAGDVADDLDRARAVLQDLNVPVGGEPAFAYLSDVAHRSIQEEFIVPRLLVRMERALVVAPPGRGKTTLLRQFGVQVSQGLHPFREKEHIAPIRVLQVDAENRPFSVTKGFRQLEGVARMRARDYDQTRMAIAEQPKGLNLLRRTDRSWLLTQVEAHRPDLLIVGPLYKLFDVSDDYSGKIDKQVQNVLDDVCIRYGCALLIEHHGTHQENRASGSHLWRRWPEFRLALERDRDDPALYWLQHFDDPRDADRDWPAQVRRGGAWPWSAVVSP